MDKVEGGDHITKDTEKHYPDKRRTEEEGPMTRKKKEP
jgi:hypothetical protein